LTATENKADISGVAGDFPGGASKPEGGKKKT
jgi:hypothetical protein